MIAEYGGKKFRLKDLTLNRKFFKSPTISHGLLK
jgi:hypothetical protein